MKKRENEILSMLQVMVSYFDENQSAISAALPAFAAQKAEFDLIMDSIYLAASKAYDDLTGYAQDKAKVRQTLHDALLRTGRAGVLYYTHTLPDARLAERLRLAMRIADLRTDANLLVNAASIHQVCDAIKTLLAPFGVSAADVDALATKIAAFEAKRTTPQEVRSEASRHRTEVETHLQQALALLRDRLDPLLSIIQSTHGLLYMQYRAARKMRRTGGRRAAGKPYLSRIAAATTRAMNRSEKIENADTVLRLSSHTPQAAGTVSLYFAASAASTPAGPQLEIAASQIQNTTAAQLGWSPEAPVLVARNNGNTLHSIGIVIVKNP